MSGRDPLDDFAPGQVAASGTAPDNLREQLPQPLPVLVFGELVALLDGSCQPLVAYAGQPVTGAMRARALMELDVRHIGRTVALMFEDGDPARPVVTGILQGAPGWPLREQPGQVRLEPDGTRMVVTALRELVLRCGKSSITLRADGRVEIRGETIITQATAANRVRGGSVELN